MLGAIAGDIIGSIYEGGGPQPKTFPLFDERCTFTDDTVCTVAVAAWLLDGGDLASIMRAFVRRHPDRGYGGMFRDWARSDDRPAYGSWGNGAAMRVSPIAYAAKREPEVFELAAKSAAITHDHPDAVSGAQAVAFAMWRARNGADAAEVRATVADWFEYDLARPLDEARRTHGFDVSCAGTVPPALLCALEAWSYEDAVRNAVSLGGDVDTIACITGGLAECLFGLPDDIARKARAHLAPDLAGVVDRFQERFMARGAHRSS
jgi:ADP-ribosylglycohydrolase